MVTTRPVCMVADGRVMDYSNGMERGKEGVRKGRRKVERRKVLEEMRMRGRERERKKENSRSTEGRHKRR